ncbi:MAG: hypothetical protein F4187_02590 [Gemmatimonadetes bacterium]|nr:hypothetical protein [Gemmatimonadota bacterium]
MEDQEKQANAVSKVVILVGCAFAALFVAMVVVMAVRGLPKLAGESDDSVTYTMLPTVSTVDFVPGSGLVTYTMSPAAGSVAFIPRPGASESGRVRYEQVFREAPVGTGYRFTVAPSGASYRFHGTPFSSSYTYMGPPHGASFGFSSPIVFHHTSTVEETATGADPEEKKK